MSLFSLEFNCFIADFGSADIFSSGVSETSFSDNSAVCTLRKVALSNCDNMEDHDDSSKLSFKAFLYCVFVPVFNEINY